MVISCAAIVYWHFTVAAIAIYLIVKIIERVHAGIVTRRTAEQARITGLISPASMVSGQKDRNQVGEGRDQRAHLRLLMIAQPQSPRRLDHNDIVQANGPQPEERVFHLDVGPATGNLQAHPRPRSDVPIALNAR